MTAISEHKYKSWGFSECSRSRPKWKLNGTLFLISYNFTCWFRKISKRFIQYLSRNWYCLNCRILNLHTIWKKNSVERLMNVQGTFNQNFKYELYLYMYMYMKNICIHVYEIFTLDRYWYPKWFYFFNGARYTGRLCQVRTNDTLYLIICIVFN